MTTPTLPFPVAVLRRRSHNAKSAKDLHDAAYFAWEVSVRLSVALAGKAAQTERAVGSWVKALERPSERLQGPALRAVARLLGTEGLGRPLGGRETSARGILDALPAYRNRVIGHGSVRDGPYYERAGRTLLDGLTAAWREGVFWTQAERLCFIDSVTVEDDGTHRARVFDLQGVAPMVRDPAGTTIPADVRPGRLFVDRGEAHGPAERWVSLHPWLLYLDDGGRERVLCFDALLRTHARYLDYATGNTLSGRALEERAPGTFEAVQSAMATEPTHDDSGESAELVEGEERFGDYVIHGRLGQGAMGVVYLARQRALGRIVALKMLPAGLADNPTSLARFQREVLALSRCEHPNVVKILDYGTEDGTHFYAMEYVEGAPLSAVAEALTHAEDLSAAITTAAARVRAKAPARFGHMKQVDQPEVPALPTRDRWRHLARLFAGAANGLHHLHEAGIVHRDVKPENIIVTTRDQRAVVMDLGLAQIEDASQALTREDHGILGTLRYMPPEQLRLDLADIDRRADIYALGATLYELATGKPLLDGDSVPRLVEQILHATPKAPRAIAPGMPRDLAATITKATAKEAGDRHTSAHGLARDLLAFAEGRAVSAQPATLGYVLRVAVRRHKAIAAGVALSALVLLGGGMWFIQHLRGVRDNETQLRRQAEDALRQAESLTLSLKSEKLAADEARAEAISQLRRAEELANFILNDLTGELHAIGKLPILARTARRLRDWYADAKLEDAPWITIQGKAYAYERVAKVLVSEGDLKEALSTLEQALALFAKRVTTTPDDHAALLQMANVEISLADCLERTGRLDDARQLLGRSRVRLEGLLGSPELTRADVLFDLARVNGDLGSLYTSLSDMTRSLAHLDKAVSYFRELAKIRPDPESGLALVLYLRAGTYMTQGLVSQAYQDAREGVEVARARHAAVLAEGFRDVTVLDTLAVVLARLGRVERERGNGDAEDAAIAESLAIREQLVAQDPTNVEAQTRLAESQMDRGRRLLSIGEPAKALPWLTKSAETLGGLSDREPTNATRGYDAAVAQYYLSWAVGDLGNFKQSLEHLDRQEALLARLLKLGSKDTKVRYGLVLVVESRHNVHWRMRKYDVARTLAEDVLKRIKVLVEEDPKNANWQETLAKAYRRLGDHRNLAGERAFAVPYYEQAIKVFDNLLSRDPDSLGTQGRRVATLANMACVLAFSGEFDRAKQTLERARRLLAGVQGIPPSTGAQRNFKTAELIYARAKAGAPFRYDGKQPMSAEDHVVVGLDHYEREAWVAAATSFREALGVEAESLPSNLPDLTVPVSTAAQAATHDEANAAAWRTQALTWIRRALKGRTGAERIRVARSFARDGYLWPLRQDAPSKKELEALLSGKAHLPK